MRNISINQLIIIVLMGVLIFSDFSKIVANLQDLLKKNGIYKNSKKK